MNRRWLRCRAFVHHMRGPLAVVFFWFLGGLLMFRVADGLSWGEAAMCAFYFEVQGDPASQGYVFWGTAIVFGVVIGGVLREALQNYTERCRAMSGLVKNHTIIVGYSSLGERLVEHCIEQNLPYVLIEKSKDIVDDLLRRGEPVVVDDARTGDALPAAHVGRARQMIVASNNIETALIVTKKARDANPALQIAVRCHHDEFIDILKKLGADDVYSTSKITYKELKRHLEIG
ncbi:MAG: NAD-binding protein [Elusimicrobia bacterium]|nr:NAD-binding protein [Elusimicrobiota bacterium]